MKVLKLLQKMCSLAASFAWMLPAPAAMAQLHDDYCGQVLPAGFSMPPNQPHTGRYLNRTYGYSVTIPAGLTAYTSATGPERGFLIALPSSPLSFLRVDAAYDVFYDITSEGVHRRDVYAIREHHSLLDDQARQISLDQVAGGRYQMHLKCRGAAEVVVHDEAIVLRNREIYRLDLQTTPDRYAADARLLDAMTQSWRWEALH